MKNLLAILVPCLVIFCSSAQAKIRVVATYSILGEWVQSVGRDRVDLVVLVGRQRDAHTYEPSAADAVALSQCALIFENGLGFEGWLDELARASSSKARRVVVTRGLNVILRDSTHSGQTTREADPHVWQDVNQAIHMVNIIEESLSEEDPANAEFYRANKQKYLSQLKTLDEWIVHRGATLSPEQRRLVTSHDSFGYFARRYGFEVLACVIPSFTTDAADVSAHDLVSLVENINRANVKAIFTENISNNKIVAALAREAHVRVSPPLYTDALGPLGSPGENYVGMMTFNVETIVTALKP